MFLLKALLSFSERKKIFFLIFSTFWISLFLDSKNTPDTYVPDVNLFALPVSLGSSLLTMDGCFMDKLACPDMPLIIVIKRDAVDASFVTPAINF